MCPAGYRLSLRRLLHQRHLILPQRSGSCRTHTYDSQGYRVPALSGQLENRKKIKIRKPHNTSQQTSDIHPMLDQCWASVVDGGPPLVQHWFKCSYVWLCENTLKTAPESSLGNALFSLKSKMAAIKYVICVHFY